MNIKFNIGDIFENYGVITRLSDSSVWFGAKRYLKSSFDNKEVKIMAKESPDPTIDWRNADQVDEYYLSFNQWAGVVRMKDTKSRELLEVINNKVYYAGEYYLPYYSHHINLPEKKFLKDGYIFGYCMKMHNSFYSSQNENTVNVFYIEKELSWKEYNYGKGKELDFKTKPTMDYLKSLDLNRINSKDLNLLKENIKQLFAPSAFPYKTNNVEFYYGDFNRIEFRHRNRTGYLRIDNGYHGAQPFGNDYYVILEGCPYFTNNMDTYTRCERNEITFDKAMLDKLSQRIVKAFDIAIEANYTLH